MHRARLTRQAQNSHPSCRGRRPRRPVNSIKNAASGGIFTLSRGAERPNCDRPRSGHLSGRTRAPKASGRGGRGRNVGASVPAQKRFSLGLHPVSLGKTKEMGWNCSTNVKLHKTKRRVPPTSRAHRRRDKLPIYAARHVIRMQPPVLAVYQHLHRVVIEPDVASPCGPSKRKPRCRASKVSKS